LLEGQAERIAEFLLRHAEQGPTQSDARTDMDIDRARPAIPFATLAHLICHHRHFRLSALWATKGTAAISFVINEQDTIVVLPMSYFFEPVWSPLTDLPNPIL
jgi:hypothetical protein